MGKSTISMAIFNSFLYVYQAGYIFVLIQIRACSYSYVDPKLSQHIPPTLSTLHRRLSAIRWSATWWWSRWASWKPRKLIKPTTETSEILPDPVGFLPFLPSFGKAQSCEVVLMILMLGHWSRLKITKVRTMTLQNIGARQAVDPFTNQGLWGFPKSWGYPQSSSILDWGFPL